MIAQSQSPLTSRREPHDDGFNNEGSAPRGLLGGRNHSGRGMPRCISGSNTDVGVDVHRIALAAQVANARAPIIVTIHSFTPIYHGQERAVEIGVLHDSDTRLADAMLGTATAHTSALVMRNEPYGPNNGVTHTLREHALPGGHLNVMLEVRNDLIKSEAQQNAMGDMIAAWVADAVSQITDQGAVQCVA